MTNKSSKILTEISPGELLDKISILEIKLEKIQDKEKLKEINKEYEILKKAQNLHINSNEKLNNLFMSIKKVNIKLWDVEDKIRICEKNKEFNETFIKLARDVYFFNDERAKIKLEINKTLKSNIREVKEYTDY
tara:strand:+ start:130 stop:531 length:402 start_codon:yes stop_codon:yes gene_type:complete